MFIGQEMEAPGDGLASEKRGEWVEETVKGGQHSQQAGWHQARPEVRRAMVFLMVHE